MLSLMRRILSECAFTYPAFRRDILQGELAFGLTQRMTHRLSNLRSRGSAHAQFDA